MKVICSSSGIIHPPLPRQGAVDIVNAGFENMTLELDMCCPSFELECYGKWEEYGETIADRKRISEYPAEIGSFYEKILSVCNEKCLQIPVARGVSLPRDTKRTDLKEVLLSIHKESIRFCRKAGCSAIMIRPLYSDGGIEKEWEINRDYYLQLVDEARKNQVMILLENQCCNRNGHMVRSVCSDSYQAAEWIDELNRAAGEDRLKF